MNVVSPSSGMRDVAPRKIRRSKMAILAYSLLILCVAVILALTPFPIDPDGEVSAKQVTVAGKPYILIDGLRTKSNGQNLYVAITHDGTTIRVELYQSYWSPTPPIANSFPILVSLNSLWPGTYEVVVKKGKGFQHIGTFTGIEGK